MKRSDIKIQVFIATTQGPVMLNSIRKEDPDIPAAMNINGSQPSRLTNSYYDFVQKGWPVAKDFGYAGWRVNIAQDIDQGHSWKLAVYMGHQLFHNNQLFDDKSDGQPDLILWATGEVKEDKAVGHIKKLDEKIENSISRIENWLEQGAQVCLLIPEDNHKELSEQQLGDLGLIPLLENGNCNLISIAGLPADEQLGILGMLPVEKTSEEQYIQKTVENLALDTEGKKVKPESTPAIPEQKKFSVHTTGLLLLFGICLLSVFFWYNNQRGTQVAHPVSQNGKSETVDSVKPKSIAEPLQLYARLKQKNQSCSQTDISARVLQANEKNQFPDLALHQLCELNIQLPKTISSENIVAIALDYPQFIPITRSKHSVQIGLPTINTKEDRYYAIWLADHPISTEQQQRIQARLDLLEDKQLMRPGQLEKLASGFDWQLTMQIYRHKLTTY